MSKRFSVSLLCCLVAALFVTSVTPTFATDKVYTLTGGAATSDFNTSGAWSPTGVPTSGDNANITNVLGGASSAGQRTVTNGAITSVNFLNVGAGITGTGTGTNKLILRNTFTTSFGFVNSSQGIIEVSNVTMRVGLNSSVTFRNDGTLIVSSNATVFLNSANSKPLTNAGIIVFNNSTPDSGEINYGQVTAFTNAAGATIIKNNTGSGAFTGNFGGNNTPFINSGTILINAGVMKFDPRDAFTTAFSNASTGKIFIGANATGMVARTSNAWNNGAADKIANAGSIALAGGSWVALDTDTGLLKVSATNVNSGVISGFGTIQWRVANDTGTLLATGGVLRLTSAFVTTNNIGSTGTLKAGTNGTSGTLSFEGGNTGGANSTFTGPITVTNSSAIIFTGDSDWTINSAAFYGAAGLAAGDRGSLISSNATGGSDTLFLNNASFRNNQGTLSVVNTNGINYGQIGSDMTNNFVLTGSGSFTGQFGGNNNAILNLGTISTTSGGLLTFQTSNAFNYGGIQNGIVAGSATGTIVIANNSTLVFRRTDNAWFGAGNVQPTNSGTILFQGGTLIASNYDAPGNSDGGKIINAVGGVISVTGAVNNITNWRVLQNNGLISLAATSSVTVTLNSNGTFDNTGGGVLELRGTGSIQGGGANTFSVNGNYINDTSSIISNAITGAGGGGGAALLFTGVTAVTNNGTISFLSGTGGAGGSGAGGNTNALIAVGATGANTFRNAGTLIFGTRSNAANRIFMISNQFVNAGTVIMTNSANTGAGGQVNVSILGVTGGATTNEATGTIRMVQFTTGDSAGAANAGTLNILNGDLVNLGTIAVNSLSNNTTAIVVSNTAGSIFTNASSGRVIMEAGNALPSGNATNSLSLRADNIVNAGLLILSNSGTMNIQNSGNSTTNLINSGTILIAGGNMNVVTITNRSTATIFGNGTLVAGNAGINGFVQNAGTIESSGGLLVLQSVTNTAKILADAASSMRLSNTINTASGVLTATTANVTFVGDVSNSGIMLFQTTSTGTLTAGGINNAGGVIRVNTSKLLATSAATTITNSGTVEFISSVGTFSGNVLNGGTWILDPSTNNIAGNLTITGTRNLTNSVDIVGGSVTVDTAGSYSLVLTSSTTIAGVLTNAGAVFLQDSLVSAASVTNAATGTIKGSGSITGPLFNAGIVEATNGQLRLNSAVSGAGTYRAVAGANASTLTFVTGGSISSLFDTGATIRIEGVLTNTASIFVNAGSMTMANGIYTQSTAGSVLTNDSNAWITGTGTLAAGGSVQNAGTILASSSTLTFVTPFMVNQNGGATVAALNGGLIVTGNYTNSSAGITTFINSVGTFGANVYDEGLPTLSASTNNIAGNLTVINGVRSLTNSVDIIGGNLDVQAGGSYKLFNSSSVSVAGLYSNANGVTSLNGSSIGTFTGAARNESSGLITVTNSKTIFSSSGIFTNRGTMVYSGGVGTFSGSVFQGNGVGVATLASTSTNNIAANLTIDDDAGRTLTGSSVDIVGGNLSVIQGEYTLLNSSSLSVAGLYTNASGGITTIRSSIGTFSGAAVNSGSFASDNSSIRFGSSLLNNAASGKGMLISNESRLVVNGAFVNSGTINFMNSVGTFNGTVVNSGSWISDPSTNVFNSDYTVTSSGDIQASAGDVYIFKSNFVNQSTQSNTWNTFNTTAGGSGAGGTKFIFDGTNTVSGTGVTQVFFTAGLKLTGGFVGVPSTATETQNVSSFAAVAGFVNNFALDRLEIGNLGTNSIFELADSFPGDGKVAALFVNDLFLFGSSKIVISNNAVLYFVNSNNWSAANLVLIGDGAIRQLTLFEEVSTVPEPGVALLWISGIVTLYAAHRRNKKSSKRS